MTSNTEALARFVAELEYAAIPEEAAQRAKRQILDVIGVALACCGQASVLPTPSGLRERHLLSNPRLRRQLTAWSSSVAGEKHVAAS